MAGEDWLSPNKRIIGAAEHHGRSGERQLCL
jgi:hypothetical protein